MKKVYTDLTVDDIYEIRKENSKLFETMSDNDICDYIKKAADAFLNNIKLQEIIYP